MFYRVIVNRHEGEIIPVIRFSTEKDKLQLTINQPFRSTGASSNPWSSSL